LGLGDGLEGRPEDDGFWLRISRSHPKRKLGPEGKG